MTIGLKQEFVITHGKQVMVLPREDTIALLAALKAEFGDAVPAPVKEIRLPEPVSVPRVNGTPFPPIAKTVNGTLAGMKNGDAIEQVLRQSGRDMSNKEIFAAMKENGHRIVSCQALGVALSSDPHFLNIRHGVWGLRNGTPLEAPAKTLLADIEDIMGAEPWSLESLANFFSVPAERIKETLMFPGTRFEQVEEGVMQLKPQFRI